MRLAARNMVRGTVVSVTRGPVSARVGIDVGGGQSVSATVAARSVEELSITEGKHVTAIFKASAVILGVE